MKFIKKNKATAEPIEDVWVLNVVDSTMGEEICSGLFNSAEKVIDFLEKSIDAEICASFKEDLDRTGSAAINGENDHIFVHKVRLNDGANSFFIKRVYDRILSE